MLVCLHLIVDVDDRAARGELNHLGRRLVALAVAFGFGLGASWPLFVLLFPAVAVTIARRAPLRALRRLSTGVAVGLLTVVAIYGFVLVRAGQNPPVNWGQATTLSRLFHLVDRSDFTSASAPARRAPSAGVKPSASSSGSGGSGGAAPSVSSGSIAAGGNGLVSAAAAKLRGNFGFFDLELGWIGLALAAWGVTVATWRRRRRMAVPLAIAFAGSMLGTMWIVGSSRAPNFDLDLAEEGFFFGCYFPLVCWLALGLSEIGGRLRAGLGRWRATAARFAPTVVGVLGLALVMWSISEHTALAHRAEQPMADRYAASAFAELPAHAVLFILGAEYTQPLVYRQVVFHQRPDVTVIAADGLSQDWYREQVGQRLHMKLAPLVGNTIADARSVIHPLLATGRPVYVDAFGAQLLSAESMVGAQAPGTPIGYQPVGLLERVVAGRKASFNEAPGQLAASMRQAERTAGLPGPQWRVWPNANLAIELYSTAALEVARAYYQHHDLSSMGTWLHNVLSIDPYNASAEADLAALSSQTTSSDLSQIR